MTERTKARVLPAAVKKQIEEKLAPGQRPDALQFFLQRIFEVAEQVEATDSRYIAEPKAAVRYVLKTHPSAVTPGLAALVIERGGELALVKEAVGALVPQGKTLKDLPAEVVERLARATLQSLDKKMENGWARFEHKARPEVMQYLLSAGAPHVVPTSINYGEKQQLSLLELAANAGTLTEELAKIFKKAGVKAAAKEPGTFVSHLIGGRKMNPIVAAALIQAGYTFARTEVMRPDNRSYGYSTRYGYSRPMMKVAQAPFLELIEKHQFEAAKVVLSQAKPDLSQTDAAGRNALHLACKVGSVEMVELLAGKRGIDMKAADAEGMTPMAYAIAARQSRIVEILHEKNKATISGKVQFTDYGGSPYLAAAMVYDTRSGQRVGGTQHSMTITEYATYVRERDERWLKEFPQTPYIGETAYNDEYTYTIRGGDQVPVDQIYKEHDEQRKSLNANVSQSRQLESRLKALARPAPSMAM